MKDPIAQPTTTDNRPPITKMNKHESHNTEFKSIWKDEYLKQLCGFANAKGGKLYIGIDDNGKAVGIKNIKKLLEDIPNKIVQLLGITAEVQTITIESIDCIKIIVTPSTVPISFKGKYYQRSGSTTQELNGHQLRTFILKKDNITWDEIIIPNAKLDELDEKLIEQFISTAVNQNRIFTDASDIDLIHILKNLDLLTDKSEITRAAILLFGRRPKKYIRTATVKIGRFGLSDSDLISQDIIEGNLIQMPDKILEILRIKYLNAPITYEGIIRKEKLEYPEKALREVILNAIVHRDYGEQTDITIKVYNHKIVFWNSGTLLEPLSIPMLNQVHPSKRRNALIANIFFRMGYIEAWGRGLLLVNEQLRKAGLPKPVIEEFADGIQVTFHKNRTNHKAESSKTIKSKEKGKEKSKEKGKEKIIQMMRKNTGISINELAQQTGLSTSGVEKNIRILKQMGIIKRIGPAKGGHWEIVK